MKKKVAIFSHGGIGTGNNFQGFPLITQLVNELAKDFDITVYSLSSFNTGFSPLHYKGYCVPKALKFQSLRWMYLILIFLRHRIQTKYTALYSFWGFPMGTVVVFLGRITRASSLINILGAETANLPEINYGHLRNPIKKKLMLWTFRKADKLIAVSNYQVEIIRSHKIERPIDVIPWGVDSTAFYPVFNKLSPPLKILHVSNLNEVKDQDTLIRAFQIILDNIPAHLRIVGSDFLNGAVQRLTHQLALEKHVEFVGFVPHSEIVKHYHWADAFMLTSLSEGQNNSMAEAMMCGLLPVGTSVGSMSTFDIGSQVGVVSDCKDYLGLANKVIELYHRPDEWEKKRREAFDWVKTHDILWTVQQLKSVINNVD